MSAREVTTRLLLHRLLSDTVFEPVAQLWGLAHRPRAPRLYDNSAAPDASWGLYHICLQSLTGDCQPAVAVMQKVYLVNQSRLTFLLHCQAKLRPKKEVHQAIAN
jgi:hypothetical protein